MRESRRITRKSASNLALAFFLLPKARREAMFALYAFCREVDDVADEDTLPVSQRRASLVQWRRDIQKACRGEAPEIQVNRELQPAIREYGLPCDLFEALLDGVEMDLDKRRYENWEELELYCYRVASVVGLLSIRIFGSNTPASAQYAVCLGKALQITNILRDVRVDAARDRIYIPACELRSHGVAGAEILNNRWSVAYADMARDISNRAEEFFNRAHAALPPAERKPMIAAELMGAVYWKLLEKLRAARFNVFEGPTVKFGKAGKLGIALRAWAGFKLLGRTPSYGTAGK